MRKGKTLEERASVQKRIVRYFIALFIIAVSVCLIPGRGRPYVMPADQLFGLMLPNFSKFETLVITQFTHLVDPRDQENKIVLEEKIWLKSPGLSTHSF